MFSLRALAVFIFIASSNFDARSIGKSAACAPLRDLVSVLGGASPKIRNARAITNKGGGFDATRLASHRREARLLRQYLLQSTEGQVVADDSEAGDPALARRRDVGMRAAPRRIGDVHLD